MGTNVTQRRIIGLTGGIATGKTTVSQYLETEYGLPVLDADVYARQAVEKGGKILQRIARRYGPNLLLTDDTLNRPALGEIIFNNTVEKTWVEQQIHPFVRAKFQTETDAYPLEQTLVYAIPLLFEANLTHLVTEIWVVSCDSTTQIQRLMARNQLSQQEAQTRIQSQMDITQKCAQADYILNNSGSQDALFQQVDRLLTEQPLAMTQ